MNEIIEKFNDNIIKVDLTGDVDNIFLNNDIVSEDNCKIKKKGSVINE